MNAQETGLFLLLLSMLFGMTYLAAVFFERLKVPGILAALFVGMAIHYTSFAVSLGSGVSGEMFTLMADLGVMFLLFFIGLQIDPQEMRSQSTDIVMATLFSTALPFVFGMLVMFALGYGWPLAFIIGITRMPTAEAVIVPVLDEFGLIETKTGRYIIGAGVLDDLIELFMIAFVSIWIGKGIEGLADTGGLLRTLAAVVIFSAAAWLTRRFVVLPVSGWMERKASNLIMLMIVVLFLFGGYAEYTDLGLVAGAIVAGIVMRPVFAGSGHAGEQASRAVRAVSYGFFGVIFFLWIGLNVDLKGMFDDPWLALFLFLAAFVGKLAGIFLMVPAGRLSIKEAWAVGIGLNARLTTEIIVAKLLLDAGMIDSHLFTALVAASSVSTIAVPLIFSAIVSKWRDEIA